MTVAERSHKKAGVHYSRTASVSWLAGNGGVVGNPVSGRAGYVGQQMRVSGIDMMRSPSTSQSRIIRAIERSGFEVPSGVIVDLFGPVHGMTGPLELAMVLMALSASRQIQPVDWPTLIVGYVDWHGKVTNPDPNLAFEIYKYLNETRPSYQLICSKQMLEQMPVNASFTHTPIGLSHLEEITDHPVFTQPLP